MEELTQAIKPSDVASLTPLQRVWGLSGLYFRNRGRYHEALPVFEALYQHMLAQQGDSGSFVHKGMPLVWMSDCQAVLNRVVLAKRYLMLTLCEDAIQWKGEILTKTTGIYSRIVWGFGISHQDFGRYEKLIWNIYETNPTASLFPEWILQELDQLWMTESPLPNEATLYFINPRYIEWLLNHLGVGDGKNLERLAHYLVESTPGCRARRGVRRESTEYDVIGTFDGLLSDFRTEFGRYDVEWVGALQVTIGGTTVASFDAEELTRSAWVIIGCSPRWSMSTTSSSASPSTDQPCSSWPRAERGRNSWPKPSTRRGCPARRWCRSIVSDRFIGLSKGITSCREPVSSSPRCPPRPME